MSIQVLQATTNRLFIKKEGKIISANKNEADITIKGTVTDKEKGDPLPGVSIKVRGAQGGSISDASGKFTIRADENALLINTWLNIFAALGESLH
ncbi:MAG TPA: hypothetical protein DIT07_07870 [Sphingobacteriaceae bacterium]|nr:hypothetical protein [Sphingobacteriaceae bacterium]